MSRTILDNMQIAVEINDLNARKRILHKRDKGLFNSHKSSVKDTTTTDLKGGKL